MISKLEALIRTGDDYDLFRINPLRYATEQSIEELEAIDLFLHATNVGLFDLDRLIVCGACSNVYDRFRTLEALDPHFVCTLCTNENEATLDDLIQVTFTVSPHVRDIVFVHPESLGVEDLYFRVHFSADVKPLANGLLADFNTTASTDLAIKIGIHRGRSVAVTLNDRIDYFGQDVNIASRIQQLAGAGEIVVSAGVYRSPGVSELLESFEITEEEGIMKGVRERIPVHRIRPGAG